MTELKLNVQQNPGTIEFNFDEIAKVLDERLTEYKGAVFTEDSKKEAKEELASLRKFKDDFEKVRKAVKKQWNEPYTEFEQKMKQLTAKIDVPIRLIDSQVKEFERQRKEERRETIKSIYLEFPATIREYAPLENVYRSKWENASTNVKTIREEISQIMQDAGSAIQTIQAMQSDAVLDALGVFRESQDLSRAITYIQDYEARKTQILKAEEERKKRETETIKQETQKTAGDELLPFETPSTRTVFYKVVATEDEITELDRILDSIGLWWERRQT